MDFYPTDVRRLRTLLGWCNVNGLPGSPRQVFRNNLGYRAVEDNVSAIEEDRAVSHFGNRCEIMAHEQHCPAFPTRRFIHLAEAFLLKFNVADCQHLIHY